MGRGLRQPNEAHFVKVRVLGCSGAIAKDCRTTSFLIDGEMLVDAGTGVGDLTLEEMCRVDSVLLTHSHLDHVAALPLMVDSVASQRKQPLKVFALAGTIAALKELETRRAADLEALAAALSERTRELDAANERLGERRRVRAGENPLLDPRV